VCTYRYIYIYTSYIFLGPTDNTVVDFWRLVWQLRTPTIVMITNLTEKGRSKCARYWPDGAQEDYGPFRVVVSGEKVYSNYTIRSFHVNVSERGTHSSVSKGEREKWQSKGDG